MAVKSHLAHPTISRTAGLLSLAVCVAVVVLIAVWSYRDGLALESVAKEREINRRNAQNTANLLAALKDAETGQRGFLLTGRGSYLAPYNQAITDAPEALHLLAAATTGKPDQAARVEALKPLIQDKLAELQRTIDLYRSGNKDGALALVLTDEGKNAMDRIRQICAEVETVANERVSRQSEETLADAQQTRTVSAVGSALILGLLILATVNINRAAAQRQRLIETLQESEQKTLGQVARLDLLNRITRAIGEHQDLKSIFQVVIRSLEEQLPIDFGCMCLYDRTRESLVISTIGGKSRALGLDLALTEQAHIAIDRNGLAHCVRGKLVYEPDIAESQFPFPQRLAASKLRSVVMAPLLHEDAVFGILITARRQPNSFSSADCEFLRQLSDHISLAENQARIRTALQQAYDDLQQTQRAMLDQERLRSLGQMASGISHDINNALSPISLYTQILMEREMELPAEMRRYLEVAQRSIDDVVHTVTRLSEFSRRSDRQVTLTPVDLNRMVKHVLDLTRARWRNMPQEKGIVIQTRTELASDLPPIRGIESEIREAIVNLVFNAVDAMPNGGTLTLRTRVERNEGQPSQAPSVYLEVQDTGVGMDEETRRRCLEPFFTTKGERGTGLGLAMVFGITARHDAEIEINSAPGKGTTIGLCFPLTAPLESQQTAPVDAKAPPLRILALDDDLLVLRSLQEQLEADGHEVTTAEGGQEGIEAFRTAEGRMPFDVVITDLGMPNVDGRTVAAAIKNVRPSIPIILLTGWGQRLVEEGDLPPCVDRVVNKPPKLRELRAALNELTRRSRSAGSA
jgi:signal transduction histidine kinase/ActR/RegA family two-component response regulator